MYAEDGGGVVAYRTTGTAGSTRSRRAGEVGDCAVSLDLLWRSGVADCSWGWGIACCLLWATCQAGYRAAFCVEDFDLGLVVEVLFARPRDFRARQSSRSSARLRGRLHLITRTQHNRTKRQVIENLTTISPNIGGSVFAQTLIVESVDCCDLTGFVVTTDERHAVWVADFEAEEEEEGFKGVETAVDEVAHKEVIGVWDVAADAEELHEVMKLAVDVAADLRAELVTELDWR